jgi:hypothetical protein
MTSVEFFVRNCLIERGQPEEEVTTLEFPKLIGAARESISAGASPSTSPRRRPSGS